MRERAGYVFLLRSTLVAQLLLAMTLPVCAQQDDGSLDALWSDGNDTKTQSTKTTKPAAEAADTPSARSKSPTSIDTSPSFKVTTGGGSSLSTPVEMSKPTATESFTAQSSGSMAPLCSVETFKASDLIKSGGWPGVGPFNATMRVPNEMKDAQDNHVKLKVSDDKVTEAELCLIKQPAGQSNFLNIQMTADYFLEALGVKPARISDFNKELEKNRNDIIKEEGKPISLPAGKYHVLISAPSEEDLSELPAEKREKIALVLKVSGQELTAEPSARSTAQTPVEVPDEAPPEVKPPVRVATTTPRPNTPVKPPVKPTTSVTSTTPAVTTAVAKPPAQPGDLKAEFTEVLKKWQGIKKIALRNRSTTELAEVLAGNALTKQTGTIKFLMTQHKYYDMTSKNVVVNKVQELVPGKKYACYALIQEFRKFIDDTTGQTVKAAEDTYNVNYTIEKINDHWYISDSAVLNTVPTATAGKPTR